MKRKLLHLPVVFVLLFSGCSKDSKTISPDVNQTQEYASAAGGGGACNINLTSLKQVIRGFGGSSAWHGQLTDADCDKLFTTLGLSILRVRIAPDGTEQLQSLFLMRERNKFDWLQMKR